MSSSSTVEIASYSQWQATDYLSEYYGEVMADERFALEFIVESMSRLACVPIALEFGCGPTIHHSLPMVKVAEKIDMAEYLENNRAQVEKWVRADSDAFNWRDFTAQVLQLEGNNSPSTEQILEREQALREKITEVLPGDAFDENPLGIEKREFYPLVASHYCAEGCTTQKDEWRRCMKNIASMVKPGGIWILSACGASNAYAVGERFFPCAGVTEMDVLASLRDNGFTDIDLRLRQVPDHSEQGFSSVIFACATKKAA